jgi:cell division septal protein FtsQ
MRIKRIATWAIPTVLIGAAAYVFGYSDLIQVKSLAVAVDNSDVQSVLAKPIYNLKVGAHMARVNVKGAESALKNIGWVESASISRNWLSGKVTISIVGRKAIARVISDGAGSNTFIDSKGVIYEDQAPAGTLPLITIADPKLAGAAASFITAIPSDLIANMQSLTLSTGGDFDMEIGSVLVHWGNGGDLPVKLKVYQKLIALPENKSISAIDLSEPKFPIVKR